jgi:hypothetical protein
MNNLTLVTGIWDLGRSELGEGWSRNFDHYIKHFKQLLESTKDTPMCIFIDKENEDMVWSCRDRSNTSIIPTPVSNFNSNFFPFYDKIQEIRKSEKWLNQTGWLSDSTQAKMQWYNPMVMSKMFMLHNAKCFNLFNTDYYFWIDGGITNTIHPGYFYHDKVLSKIEQIVNKFLFICFPYETQSEIHGFDIDGMKKIAQSDTVNRVARGGFFGGHKEYLSYANDMYYGLLRDSLSQNYMGTEESIFTLMTYLDPEVFQFESIQDNGLLGTFFENLKNDTTTSQKEQKNKKILHQNNDTIIYINAFNSPEQLQMVCDSFEKYDKSFLSDTKIYLINNTTQENLFPKYDEISKKYGFIEIRKGNIGVCGGRQLAAEHFAELKAKYMLFFEDDMLLDLQATTCCKFGFKKYVRDLLKTSISIMDRENYDFLKLTFSEFYGNNSEQWSWHNVPMEKKIEYFGDIKKRPLTKFNCIKSFNNVPYAEGEVYYSNWPHIISQEGNQKMFLDTKWAYPFEQTWMSHIYTLTKQETVKPAILLASPITHNRIHFYEASERKEN